MPRRLHNGLGLGVRLAAVLAPQWAGQGGGSNAHQPMRAALGDVGDNFHDYDSGGKMPPTRESLTTLRNFRVTATVDAAIAADSIELDIDISAYLRLCVYLAGPMLLSCPALKDKNRLELKELAEDIGKTLVIPPAPKIQWGKK